MFMHIVPSEGGRNFTYAERVKDRIAATAAAAALRVIYTWEIVPGCDDSSDLSLRSIKLFGADIFFTMGVCVTGDREFAWI